MGALIFAVIAIALLALAVFGIMDEAQRKKRLKEIQVEYEEKVRKTQQPVPQDSMDYSTAPLVNVFDYGIDMSGMQDQVKNSEKNLFESVGNGDRGGDREIASLEKLATEFKQSKDFESAIECLTKARAIRGTGTTRLPLFLQQAGRFGEAMVEFNRLLDEVDGECVALFGHQPKFIQVGQSYHMRASIYDKMRLACQRESRITEEERYTAMRDNFMEKFKAYRIRANAHRKQKLDKYFKRGEFAE